VSLKAAIEQSRPNRTKCSVAVYRSNLTPAQQVELDEALQKSVDELPHAVLSRAITAEWNGDLNPGILQRHRARECRCDAR
jgi:hypothetical protein